MGPSWLYSVKIGRAIIVVFTWIVVGTGAAVVVVGALVAGSQTRAASTEGLVSVLTACGVALGALFALGWFIDQFGYAMRDWVREGEVLDRRRTTTLQDPQKATKIPVETTSTQPPEGRNSPPGSFTLINASSGRMDIVSGSDYQSISDLTSALHRRYNHGPNDYITISYVMNGKGQDLAPTTTLDQIPQRTLHWRVEHQ